VTKTKRSDMRGQAVYRDPVFYPYRRLAASRVVRDIQEHNGGLLGLVQHRNFTWVVVAKDANAPRWYVDRMLTVEWVKQGKAGRSAWMR